MPTPALISIVLLGLSATSAQGETIPLSAPACSLATAPEDAGDALGSSGSPMKVFPRATNIPKSYTGCQKVWLLLRGEWISFSTRYFENGTVKMFYGPLLKGHDQWRCMFDRGVLVPSNAKRVCPSFGEANSRVVSTPPGCLAELQSSKPSKRCSYEKVAP